MKKPSWLSSERYAPERHEVQLAALLEELRAAPVLDPRSMKIVARQEGGAPVSKLEGLAANNK